MVIREGFFVGSNPTQGPAETRELMRLRILAIHTSCGFEADIPLDSCSDGRRHEYPRWPAGRLYNFDHFEGL